MRANWNTVISFKIRNRWCKNSRKKFGEYQPSSIFEDFEKGKSEYLMRWRRFVRRLGAQRLLLKQLLHQRHFLYAPLFLILTYCLIWQADIEDRTYRCVCLLDLWYLYKNYWFKLSKAFPFSLFPQPLLLWLFVLSQILIISASRLHFCE
jgi:hypothetical protein